LHKIFLLNQEIKKNLKEYNFHKLQKDLLNFCSLDLSSFYFDIRKDILYCDASDSKKRIHCIDILNIILECLIKWYAPVLSFTTEEISQLAQKNKKKSIHEENFPEIPESWKNEALQKKWEKLLNVRQKVNIAIEEKRSNKVIGSSLEADIKISLPKIEYELLKEIDAKELFITSNVTQNISSENDISINVEKAKGTKCIRCWKIVESVKDEKCPRCFKIK
jgi:Isoleucyl-tRNA synthetase